LKTSTAAIIRMAPSTIAISIGSTVTPPNANGVSGSGDGNFSASRPQMFSARLRKMMPSAMVAMIQPLSDLVLIACRTPSRSTTAPCTSPNAITTGSISQYPV